MRIGLVGTVALAVIASGTVAVGPAAGSPKSAEDAKPTVAEAVQHDTSAPLDRLAARSTFTTAGTPALKRPVPPGRIEAGGDALPAQPVIPDATGPVGDRSMPATSMGFEGMQNMVGAYPPDPDGAVGPNHYVQMVNTDLAVYSKTGALLAGPMMISALWSGFGGDCEAYNDGDPIVQYDQLADRWLVSQFAITGGKTITTQHPDYGPYYECVAISATPDPTGAYHRYAFAYDKFPDYPKFGVWPDGYYVTYNMFDDAKPPTEDAYIGTKTCALDRSAMLAGSAAAQVCFDNPYPAVPGSPPPEYALLPSDLDGPTPPPTGSPNYVMAENWDDFTKLTMYRFHVDWADPTNGSTFDGPIYIPVNTYIPACVYILPPDVRGCVPQPGTAVRLDSLGAHLMYRLAYRNFGDHESLVVNHTVGLDASEGLNQTGIGWYEIRSPGAAAPEVYQQGTTADPDGTTFRWMGSIAMDRQGNIALGYSTSSTIRYPSINYVGRLATDPLNTLPMAEGTIFTGAASQTGPGARWGDYSSMSVDPVDDCTFWYTNEYVGQTGRKSWRTRIASFTYPSCQLPGAPTGAAASAGSTQATVSWTAPSETGAAALTGFTATASPGGATCTASAPATSCTITGLANGTPYTATVTAANRFGAGPASAATATVTPVGLPGAPSGVAGSAGNGEATVTWTAPADTGGSPITGYTVTASPGGATCTTTGAGTCLLTGLANGTPYTATVTATNAQGTGPASAASAAFTPVAVVQRPVRPLRLPRDIADAGWTRLFAVPVRTNAGQTATWRVTGRALPRAAAPGGDQGSAAIRVVRRRGAVWVWVPGTRATLVRVRITAPPTAGYTAYRKVQNYRTRAVR